MAGRGHTLASPPFWEEQEVEVQPFSQAVGYVDVSNISSTNGPPLLAAIPMSNEKTTAYRTNTKLKRKNKTEPRCREGLWRQVGPHQSKRGKTWKLHSFKFSS